MVGVGGCSDSGAGSRDVGMGEDGLHCWRVAGCAQPPVPGVPRGGGCGGYTHPSPGPYGEDPQP